MAVRSDDALTVVGILAFLYWLLHRETSTGVVLLWTDPNTGIQYPVDQTCTDAQGVTHPAGECSPAPPEVIIDYAPGGGGSPELQSLSPLEYWSGAGDAPPPDWWLT